MKTILLTETSNTANAMKKRKFTISLFIITALLTVLFSSKLFSQEQKAKFNTGLETYMSGNGNGAFFSAYVGMDKGRSSLSIGPSIQKRSLKVNTGKLSYSYILAGYKKPQKKLSMYERAKTNLSVIDSSKLDEEDFADYDPKMQLRFYSYFQYTYNASVRHNIEIMGEQPENIADSPAKTWDHMRISTAEIGIGAELQIRLAKKIWWKNTVSVSTYKHLNSPVPSCHNVSPISLTIGTGFNIPGL